MPAKTKTRIYSTSPGGDYIKIITDVELTSILINPDHDTLGSFLIDDIKEGAFALFTGGDPPGKYIWREGKVVADVDKVFMAQVDAEVENILAEKSTIPRADVADLVLKALHDKDLTGKALTITN